MPQNLDVEQTTQKVDALDTVNAAALNDGTFKRIQTPTRASSAID
jgi:hypothetical protein